MHLDVSQRRFRVAIEAGIARELVIVCWATGYGLRATGYGLRATGYGLRATG